MNATLVSRSPGCLGRSEEFLLKGKTRASFFFNAWGFQAGLEGRAAGEVEKRLQEALGLKVISKERAERGQVGLIHVLMSHSHQSKLSGKSCLFESPGPEQAEPEEPDPDMVAARTQDDLGLGHLPSFDCFLICNLGALDHKVPGVLRL